jgi:hypothetical protein
MDSELQNIEGRNSIDFYEFKRQSVAIPSFEILRFDILLFCGSLFNPAAEGGQASEPMNRLS